MYADTYILSRDAESLLELEPAQASYENSDESGGSGEDIVRFERMKLHGLPWLCRIPLIRDSEQDQMPRSSSEEERARELTRASDHGWELLRGMEGQCLYYGAGWWFYSFCFNEGVKQFHPLPPGRGVPLYPPQEDPSVQSYVLGRVHDQDSDPTQPSDLDRTPSSQIEGVEVQSHGDINYLVQRLGDGTICDLTGEQRQVEIQFYCYPGSQDRIHLIKETSSCMYLMIVHTPRLCNDLAFMPPQAEKPHTITCTEIVEPGDEDAWIKRKAEQTSEMWMLEQELEQLQEGGNAGLDTGPLTVPTKIGGIEVGAQIYVGGSPERSISGSNIVAGNKQSLLNPGEEKYVATLAKSDGKYKTVISESEMKRIGIKGKIEDMNELIYKMERWAGEGQAWKLEVVQTMEGIQYRGILLEAGEEGDENQSEQDRNDQKDAQHAGEAEETAENTQAS